MLIKKHNLSIDNCRKAKIKMTAFAFNRPTLLPCNLLVVVILLPVFTWMPVVVRPQAINPFDIDTAWNFIDENGKRTYDPRLDPSRSVLSVE